MTLNSTIAMHAATTLLDELRIGSDRHIAIVGAALVEFGLDYVLNQRLARSKTREKRVFRSSRDNWNLATKIDVAGMLRVVDSNDEQDLNAIREIRNTFAHQLFSSLVTQEVTLLSFSSPDIESKINSLHCLSVLGKFETPPPDSIDVATPRGKFQIGVWYSMVRLIQLPHT